MSEGLLTATRITIAVHVIPAWTPRYIIYYTYNFCMYNNIYTYIYIYIYMYVFIIYIYIIYIYIYTYISMYVCIIYIYIYIVIPACTPRQKGGSPEVIEP